MKPRQLSVLLIAPLLLFPLQSALAASVEGTTAWISFDSRDELLWLAQRLDVWEVHHDAGAGSGRLLAWVTPAELTQLTAAGFYASPSIPLVAVPATIPDYACYRTVAELHAQLDDWAAAYPELTELRSIGQSYEGRPLKVLRITNETVSAEKPAFFLMAGIHGRELIAPEAAMAFVEHVLTGYGQDPDITWLVDYQTIEVLVSANPDGHVRNESGQPWAYWRKNANPENGSCWGTQYGIDLNRNSGFAWGNASSDPCSELYQGPSLVSEVETQAIESYMRSLFPDQRSDGDTSPAPATVSGLFISLHSYGDLVLWPWGYTYDAAPNADALSRLGRKLAEFNGYSAWQASDLYPSSGTTDDFAYGELGVAAYTFEIGDPALDGFYPACSRYAALVEPNLGAFMYAAKAARAPYLLPAGPDVMDITTAVDYSVGSTSDTLIPTLHVVAALDDNSGEALSVATAEVAIEKPPWAGGRRVTLSSTGAASDVPHEVFSGTVSLAGLAPGRHLIFVRGQDDAANWGPVTADFITVAYGLALAPAVQSRAGRLGTSVTHVLSLTNTGSISQTLTLTHTTALWPTVLTPTKVTLLPGEVSPVNVTVSVPAASTTTFQDAVTVTVASNEAPWLGDGVLLETVALWATSFLPLVVRQ